MKYEKYEKPVLEEFELVLEGSFFVQSTTNPDEEVGGLIDDKGYPIDGEDWY